MSTKVWIKWDGIYDLTGICNKPLKPLTSDMAELSDVKERLKLLGFDCGKLDSNFNKETKKAMLVFNGFCDHPGIDMLADPRTMNWREYFDLNSIQMLGSLEDKWAFREESEEMQIPAEPRLRQISRSHMARGSSVDYTMNSTTKLAVKVVSVPKAFIRYSEFAGIELEITGLRGVKSLLFRVYRNSYPENKRITISEDLLVYQEVLDSQEIRSLPLTGPKGNIGKHHEAKAYIMSQMAPDRPFPPMFGEHIGKVYDRLHAPYKIRVWVSTIENYFDPYTNKEGTESRRKDIALQGSMPDESSRGRNIYYLDAISLEEMRKSRRDSLKKENKLKGIVSTSEPEVDHKTTVHDKSNEESEKRGNTRFNSWNELKVQNSVLSNEKRWTGKNLHGKNVMETPCEKHDTNFLRENQIQPETFPETFAQDPIGVYKKLRTDLDALGENFSYPELKEVFDNVKRHINIIHRRLCCGQWSAIDEAIKKRIVKTLDKVIIPVLNEMEGRSYPYYDSITFIHKFINFFSFIAFVSVTLPEFKFYSLFGLQEKKLAQSFKDDKYVGARRNKIDGNRTDKGSEIGFNASEGKGYAMQLDEPEKFFSLTTLAFENMHLTAKKIMEYTAQKVTDGAESQIAKPIVLPSYNPLDPHFFIKIRSVPMFLVGIIDLRYLPADGIRQTPITFFEHDHFHIVRLGSGYKLIEKGGTNWGTPPTTELHSNQWFGFINGKQQWSMLYRRLFDVLRNNSIGLKSEWDVYSFWQKNIEQIISHLSVYSGVKKDTLNLLIFWILHEPLPDTAEPCVPEKSPMLNRLRKYGIIEKIKGQDSKDFFGDYTHPFMPHIDKTARNLEAFLRTDFIMDIKMRIGFAELDEELLREIDNL